MGGNPEGKSDAEKWFFPEELPERPASEQEDANSSLRNGKRFGTFKTTLTGGDVSRVSKTG